jgi:hypothetical protein
VFTGVSGYGKSSLAFGTLYAEAQRRYLESVSPYARRLFHQMAVPELDSIDGLPPAVALQQQRGSLTTRSSVGSVTTLSNLFRMLYSRAGEYPPHQAILYAESFSPNTPGGACPNAAPPFRQRGRRRRDEAAGSSVGKSFQSQQGTFDCFLIWTSVSTLSDPFAPIGYCLAQFPFRMKRCWFMDTVRVAVLQNKCVGLALLHGPVGRKIPIFQAQSAVASEEQSMRSGGSIPVSCSSVFEARLSATIVKTWCKAGTHAHASLRP